MKTHDPSAAHAQAQRSPGSLLMASAWHRLLGTTALLAALWGAVAWALGG